MPRSVRVAATLSECLGAYGVLMAPPGVLLGMFVGPHFLIPALVHGAFGLVLFILSKAVIKRSRWSRWSLFGFSLFSACALAATIVYEAILGSIDAVGGVIFLGLSFTLAFTAVLLLSSSARTWFGSRIPDDLGHDCISART
jgi:hypothetical protein